MRWIWAFILWCFLAPSALAERPLRIVAFGDSTTAFRSTVSLVYSQRLAGELRRRGLLARTLNEGVPGRHSGRLTDSGPANREHALDRIDAICDLGADIAIVQLGWNDSTPPASEDRELATQELAPPRIALQAYRQNVSQLVRRLQESWCHVVLMTPNPPRDSLGAEQRARTERYAEVVREIARERETLLVDVWRDAQFASQWLDQPLGEWLLDDIHPNDALHQWTAAWLAREIEAKLASIDSKLGRLAQPKLGGARAEPLFEAMDHAASDVPRGWEVQVDDGKSVAIVNKTRRAELRRNLALPGDFRVRIRMRLENQRRSAASIWLDDNVFGLEGSQGRLFTKGPQLGTLWLGEAPREFSRPGDWFECEIERAGSEIRFFVNDRLVRRASGADARFTQLRITPFRSRMHLASVRVWRDGD